jgi:hypothetical protein
MHAPRQPTGSVFSFRQLWSDRCDDRILDLEPLALRSGSSGASGVGTTTALGTVGSQETLVKPF